MAGTSAGALVVAGLLVGRTPAELSRLFDDHGPTIFPARGKLGRLRWIVKAKYSSAPLAAAVESAMNGENPLLGDFNQAIAFPAIDESSGRPVVFTNTDPAHARIPLRDAVLASASAPTYFPAHRILETGRRYVDGGLFANAPDMAAIIIARSLWPQLPLSGVHLLSIGTTNESATSPFPEDHPGAGGLWSWATRPPARILSLAMRGQVDHAMDLLARLQLADFIRIDANPTPAVDPPLALDNASPAARQALARAGGTAVANLDQEKRARLQMILARNRWIQPASGPRADQGDPAFRP